MRIKYIFLLFTVLCTEFSATAQGDYYQFSHLDIDNGLSHNRILSIYKDEKGFMWFGTMSGLNRYDGYRFKIFNHKISDSSSISDDLITNITSGPNNKIWFQTRNGFNIYDPGTELFNHHIKRELSKFSVPDSLITNIKKDRAGNFLFLHASLGFYQFNPNTQKTIHYLHVKGDTSSLYSSALVDMESDSHNNYWLIYNNGVIEKMDHITHKITRRIYNLYKLHPSEPIGYKIFIDKQDEMWAFCPVNSLGVFYVDPLRNIFKHLDKEFSHKLSSDVVYNVLQDEKGLIWIATDHGGVNLVDKKDFTIRYILNRPGDNKSLCQNSIISMYKDNLGIFWIGTFKKGISYYHPSIIKFPLYRHQTSDPNSLSFDDVNKFVEDAAGNIWIGSNGGGLICFNRKTGIFKNYVHDPSNPNSLCNNVIASLCFDHQQKLWIGTYFGGMDCFDGQNFTHYKYNANDPTSISDDSVWEIMEDSKNRLWVGTLKGGLDLFDRQRKVFYHNKPGPGSVSSPYVSGLLEDYKKNIWISSTSGIDVLLDKTNKFIHFEHSEANKNSLINNNVSNIIQDSHHFIWAATNEGLSMFDPASKKFRNFRKEDGLPDNACLTINEDDDHNFWISTPNGLSNMIVSRVNGKNTYQFKNYDQTDGLQGLEFNEDAGFKTREGELVFGGANGFNMFKPASIGTGNSKPILALTDFQVFNQSVGTGQKINDNVILSKSITYTKNITLNYNQNVFSIEFAAINFFNPAKVKHTYMLEGFDKGWITADNKIRKANYMNLDPGSYVFKLKASNEDGIWNSDQLLLNIKILPPFWKTTFAYILYSLFGVGLLFYIRHRGIQKLKLDFAIEQERQEAHRMHELDLMKIKFFTNVSHEFRTPLSLILAPIDKILKSPEETDQRKQLQMIRRNAKRLLNLVNQLLDFRKMEVQELKLNARRGDIVKFIEEAVWSFSDIAEKKNIEFVFESEIKVAETTFDPDKIERVIFNLLSNAFKFTSENGHVSVMLSLCDKDNQSYLEINIIDTGIGIAADKKDKIFERFFQNDVPGSMVNQGSGIGLSITKEFVKLHNGDIKVNSTVNEGSCFTILLPLTNYQLVDVANTILMDDGFESGVLDSNAQLHDVNEHQTAQLSNNIKKPVILLVEDNEDFRFYLKDNLKEFYQVVEATHGKEGWQKTLALHPKLVVSDISMPEMNGIDLTKKIKSDQRTAHVPVILLTALTGEEEQLKGLETGASDYLTKPFNFEILLSKIKNLIAQQNSLKETYKKQIEHSPKDANIQSFDEKFMVDVLAFIESNMADPDFSVEKLSADMAVSRVTLYRKILSLTGKTPVEFIKMIRLKRSVQLLEKGNMSISEVAYLVGFNNPKYFAKSFKSEYNILPSECKSESLKHTPGLNS
jgi:signal transduction histidine kinase/ligand-binding sensor domain-containing protein/DNA-binding response OmpR family regulator